MLNYWHFKYFSLPLVTWCNFEDSRYINYLVFQNIFLSLLCVFKLQTTLKIMAQDMSILPVRCSKCNAVFDLWYDLEEQGKKDMKSISSTEMNRLFNQFLCWQCRKSELPEVEKKEKDREDSVLEEDYEMLFDYNWTYASTKKYCGIVSVCYKKLIESSLSLNVYFGFGNCDSKLHKSLN